MDRSRIAALMLLAGSLAATPAAEGTIWGCLQDSLSPICTSGGTFSCSWCMVQGACVDSQCSSGNQCNCTTGSGDCEPTNGNCVTIT